MASFDIEVASKTMTLEDSLLPPDYFTQLKRFRLQMVLKAACRCLGYDWTEIETLGNHLKEKGMV